MNKHRFTKLLQYLIETGVIIALYLLAARLGRLSILQPDDVLAWAPAAGIAIGAVVIFWRRAAVGILLGVFLDEVSNQRGIYVSLILAIGESLGAFVGAYFLRRKFSAIPIRSENGRVESLVNAQDILFFISASAGAAIIAPLISTTVLCFVNFVQWNQFSRLAAAGWLAHMAGIFILGPILVILKQKAEKREIRDGLLYTLATAILGFSIIGFLVFWQFQKQSLKATFDMDTAEMVREIQEAVDEDITHLIALQSFFAASQNVERNEFMLFTKSQFEVDTSTQALEWIPLVPADQLSAYEEAARQDGYPDFFIFEKDADGKSVPVQGRAEYFPVYYLEPFAGNEISLGFDLGSQPDRLEALTRARASGEIVSSAPLTLIQDTGRQKGMLLFLAIYENAVHPPILRGFVVDVLQIDNVVRGALGNTKPYDIELYLFDATSNEAPQFLTFYTPRSDLSQPASPTPTFASLKTDLYNETSFEVGGRTWLIITRPGPAYLAGFQRWIHWGALLIGLVVSGTLLAALMIRERADLNLQIAQSALLETEARFRATFEQAAVGIGITGIDGRWLRINQKLCDIVGYTPDELMKKTFKEITHPDDLEVDIGYVTQLLANEINTFSMEKRYLHKNGSIIWINLNCSLVRDEAGAPKYFIAIIEDISMRIQMAQALSDAESRYRTIVEQTPAIVYVDEIGGNWRYLSPQVMRIFGYTPEEFFQDKNLWGSRIHPQDSERLEKDIDYSSVTGEALISEYRFTTKDGRIIWLRDEAAVIPEDSTGKILLRGVLLDISERKQIEAQIYQLNTTLEQRVIERTTDLQKEISERKQVQVELQSALIKTKILYDVAQASIDSSTSLPALFQKLVDYVAQSLPANRATLIIFDQQRQVVNHIVRGGPGADQVVLSIPYQELMEGLSGWAIRTGKPALSPKDTPDARESEAVQKRRIETNCGAILVTPLRYQDQIIGTLTVINLPDDRDFTIEDVALLDAITTQAATAIINARLFEDLQQANHSLVYQTAELEKQVKERTQAQESLSQSEERFRLMAWATQDAVWDWDLVMDQILWGGGLQKITHYSSDETQTNPEWRLDHIHPEDQVKVNRVIDQAIEGGMEFWSKEYRFQRANGTYADIMDRAYILRDDTGKPYRMIGAMMDITESKQLQDALQSSNELLRQSISEVERRNREILLLSEVTNLLDSSESLENAYKILNKYLPNLFPTEAVAVFIHSASRNLLEAAASWGEFDAASETSFQPSDCRALQTGKAHVVQYLGQDELCKHVIHRDQPPVSYICIPLMAHGETTGVFHVQRDPNVENEITTAEELLVYTVAEHVSLSLANINLRASLLSQSIRDPLTGLFNRRYMEESLERELKRAERNDGNLVVAMLDFDHFKKFNDTYGHAAGDAALREFGKLILANLRSSDIACRYGGEEFLLILAETNPPNILDRLEFIRNQVKQMVIEFQGQALGSFTVSAGFASFPENGTTVESLLKAADHALYQAKHSGRDRVVLAVTD